MLLFAKLFFTTVIFLLICYIIGAVVICLFKLAPKEQFFILFLNLLVGLSIIISSYALICTHGNTIQAAIILLIISIIWMLKTPPANESLLPVAHEPLACTKATCLRIVSGVGFGIFCLQYFILYDFNSEYLQTPFVDYVYYSRLSLPLNNLGLETNSLEAIYTQFLSPQPYHYAEIWLNALLVRVTGLPSAWTFFISSASVLLIIVFAGFSAIFAHFKLQTIWIIIFALLFLFVTGIRWPFLQHYDFVANGALLSSNILCLQPKLAPVYIFMLLSTLLLLNRYYIAAGAALAVLPLSFVSTAPAIGIGTIALASYLLLTQQLSWIKAFVMGIPIVLSTLYIILFYSLHLEPYHFPDAGRNATLQSIIPQLSEAKVILNIIIGVFINYIIYFAAYGILLLLVLLLLQLPKLLSGVPVVIWVFFGISLTLSAIMRALGTHHLDGFQFFSNVMLPLTPVVLAIFFAVALRHASISIYILTIGFFLVLIIVNFITIGTGAARYSSQFLRKISEIAPRIGYRGAYILGDEEYTSAYVLSSDSYTAGNYISNFKNDYALVSLSELDITNLSTDSRFKRDSAQAKQVVQESSLYRFAKLKLLNQQKLSLDSVKYKFVIDNNIRFICASKKAKLPVIIQALVSVAYIDKLSGERFYLLDYKRRFISSTAYK